MIKRVNHRVALTEGNGIYRMYDLLEKEYAIGFVTAFRGEYDLPENRRRNKRLEKMIKDLGFGYRKLEGHYVENGSRDVIEETFAVNAKDEDWEKLALFLQSACKEFDQESTIFAVKDNAYILTPTTDLDRIANEDNALGSLHYNPAVLGKYYSSLRGKGFRFGDAVLESYEARLGFTTIGGQYIYERAHRQLLREGLSFCHNRVKAYDNARSLNSLRRRR